MRKYETKVYNYVDKKTRQYIVKATTMYAGKTVSAFAKCDPDDTFDFTFGSALALKRLDLKIAKKRAASMKKYTKFCQMNLDFIECEKRRIKGALERAQIAASDRQVEIKEIEASIANMLANI